MVEKALSKALSRLNILREDREMVLKPEQETAVSELLHGRDVLAVLPTGFLPQLLLISQSGWLICRCQ